MTPDQAAFVESFAVRLFEAGMPRMPSRVFGALLVAPSGGVTAREIGEQLTISAGAVSGATRYLTQTGLAERRRAPGERRDRFEVRGASWAEAMLLRSDMVRSFADCIEQGIDASEDPGTVERLRETHDFFDFLADELPKLVGRWREVQDSPS